MPSPPIVTLSPDIPTELFHLAISNPASSNSSPYKNASLPPPHLSFLRRLTTGGSYPASLADIDRVDSDPDAEVDTGATSPTAVSSEHDGQADIEAVDAGLSPTSAYASLSNYSESRPVTPGTDFEDDHDHSADRSSHGSAEELDDHLDRFDAIGHTNYYTTSIVPRKQAGADVDIDPYFLDAGRYALKRSESRSSGRSCDSKETIRPAAVVAAGKAQGQGEGLVGKGEVTPRAGKRPAFEIGSQ